MKQAIKQIINDIRAVIAYKFLGWAAKISPYNSELQKDILMSNMNIFTNEGKRLNNLK